MGPDGAVMLDIDQGLMISVNVVGAKIWQRVEQGLTVNEIVDQLCIEFAMPRETIEVDVHDFLQSLRAYSLIDWPKDAMKKGEALATEASS